MPASMDAPMSSVWMWQFHSPSPPTTTIDSPISIHVALKASIVLVGGVEQVHDLVAGALHPALVAARSGAVADGDRRLRLVLRRLGHRPAVDHLQQGVEEEDEPGAPGVDHPRLLEHGEQLGRAGQGVPGRADGRVEDVDQGPARRRRHRTAASDASRTTVRIVPSTGRMTAV